MSDLQSILSWAQTALQIALATAFLVAAIVYGRRIGGVGGWLVASVPIVDVAFTMTYRLVSSFAAGAVHNGHSRSEVQRIFDVVGAFDTLATLVIAVAALAGFALMGSRRA